MKRFWLTSACLIACALPAPAHARIDARASYSQETIDDRSPKKQEPEIKEKPEPSSYPKGKEITWQGKIVVRMVLRANGKVTDISILQGGPPELNKLALKAAKKIKFTPAMKDGHAVSQWVTIEYTFVRSDEDKK